MRTWLFLVLGIALWAILPARMALATPPSAEAYVLHCSGCHKADGAGVPGMVPSLHALADLANEPEGRAYLARVPGVAQAPVGDQALADLLNWVLIEFSDASFAPYSVDEIASWRQNPLRDPLGARPGAPLGDR